MFITNDLFWTVVDLIDVIVTVMVRDFKVFYNRRYFLNWFFLRYGRLSMNNLG
jgi:ribosomal silencing factor RsfS